MIRGVFATTAAFALAIGVNLSAFDGQHGNSAAHATQPASHGQAPTTSSSHGSSSSHGGSSTKPSGSGHSTSGTTSTSSTSSTTGNAGTLSPVQQKLTSHTQLAGKLQTLLPSGTNVVTAAGGFRNLGQFVAAVHVSHNLGIPFAQLKTDMVSKNMSLGQSIQALRPSADSTHEVERAETQTRRMMDSDGK